MTSLLARNKEVSFNIFAPQPDTSRDRYCLIHIILDDLILTQFGKLQLVTCCYKKGFYNYTSTAVENLAYHIYICKCTLAPLSPYVSKHSF